MKTEKERLVSAYDLISRLQSQNSKLNNLLLQKFEALAFTVDNKLLVGECKRQLKTYAKFNKEVKRRFGHDIYFEILEGVV